MIKGECLCGAVQFEVASVVGPFELCHCNRCRKSSGSAYAAIVGVAVEGFRVTSGAKLIRSFEFPIVELPPGYRRFFCQELWLSCAESDAWWELAWDSCWMPKRGAGTIS